MIVCGVIALAIYFKNRKKNDNDIDRLGQYVIKLYTINNMWSQMREGHGCISQPETTMTYR